MSQTQTDLVQDNDYSISVRYTDPAMEMGSVAIPRLFLRFYQYLRSTDGQRIDPREAFFLLYIIAEKESNNDFRLATMVCPFPVRTRTDYAGKLRAMGLIYSIPHYVAQPHTAAQKRPPATKVHHVDWVLDALFYNLSQVYRTWHAERESLKLKFGKPKLFYRLPDDFTHTIEIAPHLAVAITEGRFYRVTDHLIAQAREITAQLKPEDVQVVSQLAMLPTGNLGEGVSPSVRSKRSHGEPSVRDWRTHGSPSVRDQRTALVVPFTTTTTTGDAVDIKLQITEICAIFANAIGEERYDPTERETRDIAKLLVKGVSHDDFRVVIGHVVEREQARGKTVRSIAYCLPAMRESAQEQRTEAEPKAELGSPKPPAVTVQPQAEAPAVARTDAPTLDALANGNAELRDLLEFALARNPGLKPDKAWVRTWTKLVDDFAPFAKERGTSPEGLVMQGLLEAVGANSDREGYLAPNLVRRILERWQREAQKEKERAVERAVALSADNADEAELPAEDRLRDQWATVLKRMRAALSIPDFSYLANVRAVARVNGTLRVQTPDSFQAEWIRDHALAQLAAEVSGVFGEGIQIEFVTTTDPSTPVIAETTTGYAMRREGTAFTANDVWHATLGELQLQMTRATFDTWVRQSRALGWNGDALVVGVHSPYAKDWLENRLNTVVRRALVSVVGQSVEIAYVVADHSAARTAAAPEETA